MSLINKRRYIQNTERQMLGYKPLLHSTIFHLFNHLIIICYIPIDIKKLILYKLLKYRVTDYFKHLHINYIIRTCIQLNSKNILKVVTIVKWFYPATDFVLFLWKEQQPTWVSCPFGKCPGVSVSTVAWRISDSDDQTGRVKCRER